MIRAFYTSVNGAMTQGTDKFDTLVQNMVNASTPGFRAQYMQQVSSPDKTFGSQSDVQVQATEYFEDNRPGQLEYTGEKLDVDLDGEALFTVQTGDDMIAYSRNGRFRMRADGSLTDRMGNRIMGERGPIRIPPDAANITIDQRGSIIADDVPVDRLKLASFDEGANLKPIGGGLYLPAPEFEPNAAEVVVTQGYYERSNVNVMEEMVRMLTALRSVESQTKMMTALSEDTVGALIKQTGKVG